MTIVSIWVHLFFSLLPPESLPKHLLTPWASQLGSNREIGDQTEKKTLTSKICKRKVAYTKMRFGIFGHYLGLCISITLSWKRVSSRVKRNALDFTQLAEKKEQKRYLNRVWGKRPEVFVLFPVELSSFSPILTLAKSMTKLPRAYVLPFFSALAPLLLQDWPVFWVLYKYHQF